ncbi:MAG: thioredoxin domain-containing protein, partial [Thermocladium sp.]
MDRVTCLTGSGSPYLLKAATSPINWWGWCKEAFELARNWNRPILVDVGALWCHWCNVMDEETYNDQEIAQIINEHFIPIKVDRDERPDIDKKLQSISTSISGQAGWPLTVFLTPSGEAIFAGTYFPPRDSLGLPGMPRVLKAVLQAHREGNAIKLDL